MSDDILTPVRQLALPNVADDRRSADSALVLANEMTIEDDEGYEMVAEEVRAIKSKLSSLEARRTTITGPMNEALRAINALFAPAKSVLEQAEAAFKGKMIAYNNKKAIEAEAQRRAAIEAEAQRQRDLDEQRKKAEAEAATATTPEQQERAAEALEAIDEEIAAPAAPVVVAAPIKVAGISTRKTYKPVVNDKLAFLAHIVNDKDAAAMFAEWVTIDQKKLNAYHRAMGTQMKLPGITVIEDLGIAVR